VIDFQLPSTLTDLWLSQLPPAGVPYVWIVGSNETNCTDCLVLDGEVRTLEEWLNTITPGSPNLSCYGHNCRCRLEATIRPISGRAVQTILKHGNFGRLYFGNKAIWHIDLNPPGRLKPRPEPPSHHFPQALPDLRPRRRRTRRWW
jgi:hypothetical protein